MKIKCDFCKTEYNADNVPNGPVRCAVCGHVWNVARPPRRNAFMVILAASCALLSAIVFTITVITHSSVSNSRRAPLVATVSGTDVTTDDAGVAHFIVNGTVENRSDQIYGVPDLIIYSWDASGHIIARQKFLPSATLLDAGTSVKFSHILSAPTTGVKKITVKLDDTGATK